MTLARDGNDYHVLDKMCEQVKNVPGLICEVGLNKGGGMELLINSFHSFGQKRIFVGIDPYGDIPYADMGGIRLAGYNNKIKSTFLKDVYSLCDILDEYFIFYNMTDMEFFKRFSDGVPVYQNNTESIVNHYALVVIDGPHTADIVKYEFDFFKSRISPDGVIVFDDIEQYNHIQLLNDYILQNGFVSALETAYKAAYRKV